MILKTTLQHTQLFVYSNKQGVVVNTKVMFKRNVSGLIRLSRHYIAQIEVLLS